MPPGTVRPRAVPPKVGLPKAGLPKTGLPKAGLPKTGPADTARFRTGSAAKATAPRALRDAGRIARAKSSPAGLALPRMHFVLLVLGLLGGGLVCLLVVNTTLGATSFRLSQLQRDNAKLSLQEQSLQGTIQNEQAPEQIAQRAYQLGMRAESNATILDLRNGRSYKLHDPASALVAAGTTAQTTGVTKTKATGGRVAQHGAAKPGAAKRGVAKHRVGKHRVGKHRTTTTKAGSGR
jgi:hypothetical protein